jgi:protein-tyrosine phosphatase
MIDLHCHLLPGIDDGPESLEDALAMARSAHASGIRAAVLTPHLHLGRYENTLASIRTAASAFANELEQAGIPLRIGYAAEVRICAELTQLVDSGEIPFLGEHEGRRVMLLEFPHSHIPPGSDRMVSWLLDHGIQPMIAHPERNKDVMRRPDKLAPFREMGCLMQLTAGSLAGRFGAAALQRARELLEQGWVHVLASDAHNLHARRPELETGRLAAEQIVGAAMSWRLVRDNPLAIAGARFFKDGSAHACDVIS